MNWHPLETIWHPLEGPGMCFLIFCLFPEYRWWMMVVWPWGLIYNLKCIVLQFSTWVCLKIGVSDFGTPKNIEIVEFTRKPVLIRTPPPNIALASNGERALKVFSIYVLSAVQRPPALLKSVEQFLQANCDWLDSRFQQVGFYQRWGLCSTIAGVADWKVGASKVFFSCWNRWHWWNHRFPTQDMQPVEVHKPYRWPRRPWLLAEAMS